MGFRDVVLRCGHEMDVSGSLRSCLCVLLHVDTGKEANEREYTYIRGAIALRPDRNHKNEATEANSP